MRPRDRGDEFCSLARGHALGERQDILQQERNPGEATFGQLAPGCVARALIILEDDRIERGVQPFGAPDRLVEEFDRFDFLLRNQLGQAEPVILRVIADRHSIPSSWSRDTSRAVESMSRKLCAACARLLAGACRNRSHLRLSDDARGLVL